MTDIEHWSDCAVHNEPAYPAGPCDCGGLTQAEWEEYAKNTFTQPAERHTRMMIARAIFNGCEAALTTSTHLKVKMTETR